MNAREVIRRALLTCIRRGTGKPWPEVIISEISTAGFTIMSKEDVEAVRDKALEEAAALAETEGVYPELNVFGGGAEWYKHGKRIASSIRSLKSGGRDE